MHYREFRFWSPLMGQEAARISMVDDRCGEFFMIIPASGGREYREARNAAIDAISTAIDIGLSPGEVRVG